MAHMLVEILSEKPKVTQYQKMYVPEVFDGEYDVAGSM